MFEEKTRNINMIYPIKLINRIELFQESMGFKTRTQAITYLIMISLEKYGF